MRKIPQILVIGDLMIDHYLWGECERISPEAPVQIVDVKRENKRLGGAGNVIANLTSLGANVGVMGVVGDDTVGNEIENMLNLMNVRLEILVREKGRKSGQKSRLMAVHQQVIRFDKESRDEISKSSEDAILACFSKIINNYDAVLLSDYAKGVLSANLCQKIIQISNEKSKFILVDPKGKDYSKYRGATLLTPNRKEAMLATGIEIKDESSLEKAILKLKNDFDLKFSVITLSEKGVALHDKELEIIPAIAREVFDVTGAGDTVLATLGYALARGFNIKDALNLANKAAAVVVAKVGSATATIKEIIEYDKSHNGDVLESKLKSASEIAEILKNRKQQKAVFTNGCFDILHSGHVKYLNKARNLGDMLIVGLNSDASVRRLKGPSRPINGQNERALLLSALYFVDFVVIFDEDTPYELIKRLSPDILVKGADYKDKEVVGSDIVAEVQLIDFEEGFSTTNLIEKIKNFG